MSALDDGFVDLAGAEPLDGLDAYLQGETEYQRQRRIHAQHGMDGLLTDLVRSPCRRQPRGGRPDAPQRWPLIEPWGNDFGLVHPRRPAGTSL